MGQPILQLGNAANWESVWHYSAIAETFANGRFFKPFSEFECPILLDKHILAFYVTSNNAKPTWRSAGWVQQKIRLGLTVGGGHEADFARGQTIWLNRITLIIFPEVAEEFSVSFAIHNWISNINIDLWKYTGIADDTDSVKIAEIIEKLGIIEGDLIEIKLKI